MPPLIVAVGGGGDAITAAALAGPLGLIDRPVVMTYSWDRLMIDPLPGARNRAEFTGLVELTPTLVEIVAASATIPPAGSALPRLAGELPVRLLLMDPSGGAVGISEQVTAAVDHFRLTDIVLVDVGGDALTTGTDPGLRSPLADQLALAACVRTGIPTRLLVAGAGLDGELPRAVVLERLHHLDGTALPNLALADIRTVRDVFTWHPSEASGLLAAAASGTRGTVEVRDAGDHVELAGQTTRLVTVDAARVITRTPGRHLTRTTSLVEAERVVHDITGISEIAYERRKAAAMHHRTAHRATPADLGQIDGHAAAAHGRGADYISTRRLAELVRATSIDAYSALSQLLAHHRPDQYRPSVYRTSPR